SRNPRTRGRAAEDCSERGAGGHCPAVRLVDLVSCIAREARSWEKGKAQVRESRPTVVGGHDARQIAHHYTVRGPKSAPIFLEPKKSPPGWAGAAVRGSDRERGGGGPMRGGRRDGRSPDRRRLIRCRIAQFLPGGSPCPHSMRSSLPCRRRPGSWRPTRTAAG